MKNLEDIVAALDKPEDRCVGYLVREEFVFVWSKFSCLPAFCGIKGMKGLFWVDQGGMEP